MASRRSGRLASTHPVALDISAAAAEESVLPPAKMKQLSEVSANSEADKENMINKAVAVPKRTGRPRKQKALQAEVAASVPASVITAEAAAESVAVEVKAAKKVSKKKVALVLPEEEGGADDVNEEKGAVLAKKESTGVTKEEVDSVIEDLKSVGISLQSRPTRKTAVRVNYKILSETGAKEAM